MRKVFILFCLFVCLPVLGFAGDFKLERDVYSIGAGITTGFPGTGAVVRYHHNDDKLRGYALITFDYSNGYGPTKKFQSSMSIDFIAEYKFISFALDSKKEWLLDLAGGGGFGFYFPFTAAPPNHTDYFAMPINVGITANCDLPILPISTFVRLAYRPAVVFVKPHGAFSAGNGGFIQGILGATWNFNL